jgi:hypothetical protein
MSANDGIVNLWDLPENEVCVKFSSRLQKLMIKKALEKTKGRYFLAKEINVEPCTIYDFEKSRFGSVTLSFVKRLSDFLVKNGYKEFSLSNLQKKVKLIKSKFVGNPIINPKFPMNFNNEYGAKIIAGILGDGGLSQNLYPFYVNKENCLIQKFVYNVQRIVGNTRYNKKNREDGVNMISFPNILGYILAYGLGMEKGRKVLVDPSIPPFILNNPNLYSAFLQQVFDDEGSLNNGKSGKCVELLQYNSREEPPIRVLQIKKMLEELEIIVNGPFGPTEKRETTLGYTSYGWSIQISNQSNIRNFFEKVNFSLKYKRKRLKNLLSSYKTPPRLRRGTRYEKVLEVCRQLKLEGKKITNRNIANKLKKNYRYINQLTSKLVKEGKLMILKNDNEAEREFIVMKC